MDNMFVNNGILNNQMGLKGIMDDVQIEENCFADVLFIILLVKNEDFLVRAPYDIEILGKKMWEWVAMCGDGAKIKTTPCTESSDIVNLIKPFVSKERFTFVLYSDTPLLTKANCMEILDYFKTNQLNVLKLKRGFVFDSDYLLNCESILATENRLFDGEEFEKVDSFEKVYEVTKKLSNSILSYHMQNGVQIVDKNSTFIDADVVIEKGVKIEPNNFIKGNSYLAEGVILEPNNTIKDSIISNKVIVKNSYISNSRIPENMIVGPFETIIDKNW